MANLPGDLPHEEGIYLASGLFGTKEPTEIKVTRSNGILSCDARCYAVDLRHPFYGSETDFNVPVNLTGLVFLVKIGDLPK